MHYLQLVSIEANGFFGRENAYIQVEATVTSPHVIIQKRLNSFFFAPLFSANCLQSIFRRQKCAPILPVFTFYLAPP